MNGGLLVSVIGAMIAIVVGATAANWRNPVQPVSRAAWCAAHPSSNAHGAVLVARGQICDD